MGSFGPLLPVFTLFGREPIQIVASSSIDAANAARGDGANTAHQLCFTGSAATRARTRASNAPEGSICGSSSSNPETARNSFTRTRQAAHPARCASTSRCSLTFSRPSTNGNICFSIRLQLILPILPFLKLFYSALRHQRRQLHSQRLISPKQQRLQRTLRTRQNLRDLPVIQLLILVQQHRRPLLFRQFVDRVLDHRLS